MLMQVHDQQTSNGRDKPSLLVIGHDEPIVRSFKVMGWRSWAMKTTEMVTDFVDVVGRARRGQFPFQKHVFDIVLYELFMPTDPLELRHVIVDVGRTIKARGFFIVPDGDKALLNIAFASLNFWRVPLSFKHHEHWFSIYQKRAA